MRRQNHDEEFHRPVVWVTGASRGIGRDIAIQFASIGCEVCLSGRNAKRLASVAREIKTLGGRAYSYPCDISQPKSVFKTIRTINKTIGEVDVLVNNAGITVFKSFLKTTLGEFQDILQTNLYGQIACIKSVLPGMIGRKGGWIINVLSNAAVKTFEGSAAYTSAKAGMLGLGKVLREELRKYNVKVVNVLPGATETEMWSARHRNQFSPRMMRPKSVAEAVLSVYRMPDDIVVDELIVRPIQGDIDE